MVTAKAAEEKKEFRGLCGISWSLLLILTVKGNVYIFSEWGPFFFYSSDVYEEGINLTFFWFKERLIAETTLWDFIQCKSLTFNISLYPGLLLIYFPYGHQSNKLLETRSSSCTIPYFPLNLGKEKEFLPWCINSHVVRLLYPLLFLFQTPLTSLTMWKPPRNIVYIAFMIFAKVIQFFTY